MQLLLLLALVGLSQSSRSSSTLSSHSASSSSESSTLPPLASSDEGAKLAAVGVVQPSNSLAVLALANVVDPFWDFQSADDLVIRTAMLILPALPWPFSARKKHVLDVADRLAKLRKRQSKQPALPNQPSFNVDLDDIDSIAEYLRKEEPECIASGPTVITAVSKLRWLMHVKTVGSEAPLQFVASRVCSWLQILLPKLRLKYHRRSLPCSCNAEHAKDLQFLNSGILPDWGDAEHTKCLQFLNSVIFPAIDQFARLVCSDEEHPGERRVIRPAARELYASLERQYAFPNDSHGALGLFFEELGRLHGEEPVNALGSCVGWIVSNEAPKLLRQHATDYCLDGADALQALLVEGAEELVSLQEVANFLVRTAAVHPSYISVADHVASYPPASFAGTIDDVVTELRHQQQELQQHLKSLYGPSMPQRNSNGLLFEAPDVILAKNQTYITGDIRATLIHALGNRPSQCSYGDAEWEHPVATMIRAILRACPNLKV